MMRTAFCLFVALAGFSASRSTPFTLDEIIQKNIDARGGAGNWANVRTIVMRGDYEGFAQTAPFTMYRQRPDLYRFDHVILGGPVVHCFDGEKAWFYQPPRVNRARPMPAAFAKPVLREKLFEPPFWNYAEKGHEAKYAGLVDLDGGQAHKIEVQLKGGEKETWYLDPETFLEKKLEGVTWNYGRRVVLEAYFDDYRDVDGIVLPFSIEQEFHTRYRVFTIEEIEINADIEESVFKMEAFKPSAAENE